MHYFRLKPSTIVGAGVGVFATNDIPRGTKLPELFGADDVVRFSREEFAALELPDEIKDHFTVRYDTEYFLPKLINRMSVGWYLNDSTEPNLGHDSAYNYFALRDIAAGEELLINYDEL